MENIFSNLDLLSVGVVVASTAIFGFVVFFNNTQSVTNRAFLFFSLVTSLWSIANYPSYRLTSETAFWFLRATLFLAVWHAFSFFMLVYIFPNEYVKFPRWITYVLLPVAVVTATLCLSPLIISGIAEFSPDGRIFRFTTGPAMPLFGIVIMSFISAGMIRLYQLMKQPKTDSRKQS